MNWEWLIQLCTKEETGNIMQPTYKAEKAYKRIMLIIIISITEIIMGLFGKSNIHSDVDTYLLLP